MSAVTPNSLLQSIVQTSNLGLPGPVVTLKEWQTYYKDLDGWFMWYGERYDLELQKIGGGVYRINGKRRL